MCMSVCVRVCVCACVCVCVWVRPFVRVSQVLMSLAVSMHYSPLYRLYRAMYTAIVLIARICNTTTLYNVPAPLLLLTHTSRPQYNTHTLSVNPITSSTYHSSCVHCTKSMNDTCMYTGHSTHLFPIHHTVHVYKAHTYMYSKNSHRMANLEKIVTLQK